MLDIRHLIYKEDGERHDQVERDMYVKLNIENKRNDLTTEFKRTLSKDGYSQYFIDGVDVSKQEYKAKSVSGIECCISQQGKLENSPFIKGGYELTALLEKVSGSQKYKKEYEEILSKRDCNEKVSFNPKHTESKLLSLGIIQLIQRNQ